MKNFILAGLVAFYLDSGTLKNSPALDAAPIDLTIAAALAIFLLAAGHMLAGRGALSARGLGPLALLTCTFAPGLLHFGTPYTDYSTEKTLRLFLLTLGVSTATVIIARGSSSFWNALLVATVLMSLATALLAWIYPAPDTEYYGRFALEGSNTIAVARLTGDGLIASVALAAAGTRRSRFGYAIAFVLALPLVASGSRGPLIAVIVALIVVALCAKGGKRVTRIVLIGSAAYAAGVWLLSHTDAMARSRYDLLFASDHGASIDARERLIRDGLSVALDSPLGVGWGNLASHLESIANYPHDILIEVAGEGGWIALAGLLIAWCLAMRRAWSVKHTVPGLGASALIAYWSFNTLVSGDVNDNRALFVWMGVGLALGTPHVAKAVRTRSTNVSPSLSKEYRARIARRPAAASPSATFMSE